MSFESCDSWWTPQSLPGQQFCHLPSAALCWAVGLYSFSKVPFYLFAQPPPHGLEVCALLGCVQPCPSATMMRSPLQLLDHTHTIKQLDRPPQTNSRRVPVDSPLVSAGLSSLLTQCSSSLLTI